MEEWKHSEHSWLPVMSSHNAFNPGMLLQDDLWQIFYCPVPLNVAGSSRPCFLVSCHVLLTLQLLSFTNKRKNALQDPLPQGFFVWHYSKDPLALRFGHTRCVFSFTNVYGPSGTFVESLMHHFRYISQDLENIWRIFFVNDLSHWLGC